MRRTGYRGVAVLIRLVLVVAVLLSGMAPARAGLAASAQQVLSEAQAKAGFLYNCAMFVSWPPSAATRELVIGVIGDDAVAALVRDMQGEKVDGRTLRVAPVRANENLARFHILFIAGEDSASIKAVLDKVGSAPVLTVGEIDDFTADGGAVRLFTDQGRLRFEINMTRVERASLKVSAKMLGLARIVR